nr:hypothetical protein [Tanacetum cinerariifolium]
MRRNKKSIDIESICVAAGTVAGTYVTRIHMVTVAVNQNEPLLSPPSLLPESSSTLTIDMIRSLNMRTKDVVKFLLWWSSDDLDN